MSLMQVLEEHERNLKKFAALRDSTWTSMIEQHQQLATAFGGPDKLPAEYQKKHKDERAEFIKQWADGTGEKYKMLMKGFEKATAQYKEKEQEKQPAQQKKQATSSAKSKTASKDQKPQSEQDRKRAEFIRQQRAVTAKQSQTKKRSR